MRVVITGANGTVGRALRAALGADAVITPWDRGRASPLDGAACDAFLRAARPDVVFHLAIAAQPTGADNEGWRVNVEWPIRVAERCRELGARLVFTSSAMVFSNDAVGPFTRDAEPDAHEGYGFEKRRAEQAVLEADPKAVVARLGWQIGQAPGSNNMIDYLERNQREHGQVAASTQWLPACSFLDDTAAALIRLADGEPGLYQLDANDRWSFFAIARALSQRHGDRWRIEPNRDFVYDQRLIDERISMPRLEQRLDGLREL